MPHTETPELALDAMAAFAAPSGSEINGILSETLNAMNEALNAWYPNRQDDSAYACDTRQSLFVARDNLERFMRSPNDPAQLRPEDRPR